MLVEFTVDAPALNAEGVHRANANPEAASEFAVEASSAPNQGLHRSRSGTVFP